jgi:hypothetical protein
MESELKTALEQMKKLVKERKETYGKIEKLERILFKKLCPKHYLNTCEPAYCIFRITNTCKYLATLGRIYRVKDCNE